MKRPVLGTTSGASVPIDVDRLIASRALIAAQSGKGKSWTLRRVLEQTYGMVQQLVLDPEGELFTLREIADYVLVGPRGADCAPDARTAGLLARRLLELGVSAILDISELPTGAQRADSREAFVAAFIGALVAAPRKLWHPTLIAIDEAHDFCPERGKRSGPRGPAADAVIDLMAKGRKRGFAALLATQRLSKLSKDAVAEAGNVMVGGHIWPADVRVVSEMLGLDRSEHDAVKRLEPGQFFSFGPALCGDVRLVEIGKVRSTHPRPGAAAPPPAAPRAAVRAALGELGDLAQQAQAEEDERAALRAEVRDLRAQLRAARAGKASPEELEAAQTAGARAAAQRLEAFALRAADRERRLADAIGRGQASLAQVAAIQAETVALELPGPDLGKPLRVSAPRARAPRTAPTPAAPAPANGERLGTAPLSGPERRILDALAWLRWAGVERPTKLQVAARAGYSVNGGGFRNPLGKLRTGGWIDYEAGDVVVATEAGRAAGREPETPPTTDALHESVLATLPGNTHRKILRIVLAAYPNPITTERVAAALDPPMQPSGGGFRNPLGRLRTLGLLDYPEPGSVIASAALFLELA